MYRDMSVANPIAAPLRRRLLSKISFNRLQPGTNRNNQKVLCRLFQHTMPTNATFQHQTDRAVYYDQGK
jgi:hypothetical protein